VIRGLEHPLGADQRSGSPSFRGSYFQAADYAESADSQEGRRPGDRHLFLLASWLLWFPYPRCAAYSAAWSDPRPGTPTRRRPAIRQPVVTRFVFSGRGPRGMRRFTGGRRQASDVCRPLASWLLWSLIRVSPRTPRPGL